MESKFVEDFEYSSPEDISGNIADLRLSEDEADEFEDSESWKVDLEEALLEGFVDHSMIKSVCQLRVLPPKHRAEAWRICLNIASRGDPLSYWDGKLDLPEQEGVHTACVDIIQRFAPEREDMMLSDLESIITFYMKSRAIKFEGQSSWLDIMKPLLSLEEMNRADMYNCFYAILTRYLPKDDASDAPYDLFRHILMYHDPELCCFFDSKKILLQHFMKPWIITMFASRCSIEVTTALWDIYFQEADPFFGFFLSLVVLINAKDSIMEMKSAPKEEIMKNLTEFPCALGVEDIEDLCQLAIYFRSKTPPSAFRRYQASLFGGMLLNSQKGAVKKDNELAQSLCLQVSTEDIFTFEDSDMDLKSEPNEVKFFLVDCRPPDFYNDGHLRSAHHLDATLMLREPKEFSMAIESLLMAQKQAIEAGNTEVGEHMCLIGSGDKDEDQHLHMTIAYLLKNQHVYVSVVHGGFDAIVTYLSQANVKLGDWLTGSNRRIRKIQDGQSSGRSSDQSDDPSSTDKGVVEGFMKSFTATIKTKSQGLKSKVSKFMESEQGMLDWNSSKPYRGTEPIFSIGDEEEQGATGYDDTGQRISKDERNDDNADYAELKTLEEWKETYNIEHMYQCFKVLVSGKRPSVHIAVKGDDLVCLRESKKHKKFGIASEYPLASVSRISSKKKCAEMITFRFQIGDEEIAERYLIPDAGIAMRKIKQEIMRVLERNEQ